LGLLLPWLKKGLKELLGGYFRKGLFYFYFFYLTWRLILGNCWSSKRGSFNWEERGLTPKEGRWAFYSNGKFFTLPRELGIIGRDFGEF